MQITDFWDFHNRSAHCSELEWYIFEEDVNEKKIVPKNIFHYNWVFRDELIDICKKYLKLENQIPAPGEDKKERKEYERAYNDLFDEFAERVRSSLRRHFWARSEYETIITEWPPHVDSNEIDRLVKERDEYIAKWDKFYCTHVELPVAYKMDVYTQIMMNYPQFIKYIWDNRHLIKKIKKVRGN